MEIAGRLFVSSEYVQCAIAKVIILIFVKFVFMHIFTIFLRFNKIVVNILVASNIITTMLVRKISVNQGYSFRKLNISTLEM